MFSCDCLTATALARPSWSQAAGASERASRPVCLAGSTAVVERERERERERESLRRRVGPL
jgi:hypothetical protein